ncbi:MULTISPECIES: FAD-dependent oxidoreductase [Thalassotalea]|uniref:FAD-dependent oxidoreductase n=1 Tax=Thalassotalea castellviae TaxID=3075612 RepID=A0ABU3A0X3_9GAMM|nr:FAD-dependent oxidoreductase [Thalassotalea sp. W431]MDT0603585.1 FAD-dependent oxidoreductase [Thalassotalea sp. W431]
MNESTKTKKIAIVGAGIIGINCAVELQSRGYQVTLLDKNAIGEGCSKGNAGHFATEQVFPLAEASILLQLPKMLLNPLGPVALSPKYCFKAIPWFIKFIANMGQSKRRQNIAALKRINEQAIAYYKPLLAAANAEELFVEKGSLLVFENTPLAKIKKLQQAYLAQEVKVKLLDRAQTLLLEPNLQGSIQYSLYFTEVAHTVNPLLLSQKLAHYAKSLGCKIEKFDLQTITHQANNVVLNDGKTTLMFDHLVIATGAWSENLLKQLNYKLPIEAERGYSLDLSGQTNRHLNRPVASAERRFIITPMSHGLRLAGTVEFAGLKQKANMKRASMLYKNAQFIIKELSKEAPDKNQGWLGFRPSLPDSLPVICTAPNHKNMTFALGHQHLGLTLGAITGKLVGQIVANEKPAIDIAPFCISRFN